VIHPCGRARLGAQVDLAVVQRLGDGRRTVGRATTPGLHVRTLGGLWPGDVANFVVRPAGR